MEGNGTREHYSPVFVEFPELCIHQSSGHPARRTSRSKGFTEFVQSCFDQFCIYRSPGNNHAPGSHEGPGIGKSNFMTAFESSGQTTNNNQYTLYA